MLSLEESKRILNKDGMNYSDEEIIKIREFVYLLVEIEFDQFMERLEKKIADKPEAKIISIKSNLNPEQNEPNSDSLHQGFHRRAS